MTLRVVIADDHALARAKLRELLAGISWLECVAEVADGDAALATFDRLAPDLAFLDVRMPGLSGLDVLRRAVHKPYVIFTTAYAGHAVDAFELQALDYLLKPFGRERFLRAVERARESLAKKHKLEQLERSRAALEPGGHLQRIFVHRRSKILPIALADVEWLEADGDYVAIWAGGQRYLVRVTLEALAVRLDPEHFCRIHRSRMVNLDHLVAMVPFGDGRLELELRSGARLLASRSRSRVLRRRLG